MARTIKTMAMLLVIFVSLEASAQDNKKPKRDEQIRKYWFVMLMKGPTRNQDSATAAEIQKAHLANITRLYNEGKIKVAGPFGDGGDWQGLFIFDCETKEEVEKALQTDRAISSGRLVFDIRPWYTAPTGSFEPGVPKVKY